MKNRSFCFAALRFFSAMLWMILTAFPAAGAREISGTFRFVFQPENRMTQFVIWIENEEGDFAGTALITGFMGRRGGGNRTANPDIDASDGNRLSCFPVWAHSRGVTDTTYGIANLYPPDATRASYPEDIDAVSEATPGNTVQTVDWPVSLPAGVYTCRIEANQSFDFNDNHQYSFYRGQPSVVWSAVLNVSESADTASVQDYAGYGSPDGSDGTIRPPDSTITTAAGLLQNMGGYAWMCTFTPDLVGVRYGSGDTEAGCFEILRNYPNPFNASTVIHYDLKNDAEVELSVIDVTGRRICTLVRGARPAGSHRIRFEASSLLSGIYFCRLNTDGRHFLTGKMLLLP